MNGDDDQEYEFVDVFLVASCTVVMIEDKP